MSGSRLSKAIGRHFGIAGASRVIISGRTASTLEEAKAAIQETSRACDVRSVVADMTNSSSVQRLYSELPETPDIIVNNVGAAACQEKIVNGDPVTWWNDYASLPSTDNPRITILIRW